MHNEFVNEEETSKIISFYFSKNAIYILQLDNLYIGKFDTSIVPKVEKVKDFQITRDVDDQL